MNVETASTHSCRALSHQFLDMLNPGKQGKYSKLVEAVKNTKDLDLEFHGQLDLCNPNQSPASELISIYYKGNSVLALYSDGKFHIHPKFVKKTNLPESLSTSGDIEQYLSQLPQIMFNVATLGKASMEIEYEQMIIRANNLEKRNNSEYIVIYNQHRYLTDAEINGQNNSQQGRFDLMTMKWPRKGRGMKDPKGQLALIEVKYALNPEISYAHKQLEKYYRYMKNNYSLLCCEMQLVLKQKLALGLIERTKEQKNKLELLQLDTDYKTAEIILFLVDYNPYSKWESVMLDETAKMPFANQIKIAHGGLALWQRNLATLGFNTH